MKNVKESVQELYQDKVVREFYDSIKEGSNADEAYNDAVIFARGISDGGAYVGFNYDFVKCISVLSSVYESEVNK